MPFFDQMERLDPQSLPMVQRILLATDGTLTDTVEAIFNEPIGLKKLSVTIEPSREPVEPLSLPAGESTMERRVLLVGETSGRTYVYADSVLALDRLPEDFRNDLLTSNEPLGRLWSQYRLETWKELVGATWTSSEEISGFFLLGDSRELVARTYRLLSGGQPVMLISEYFPADYAANGEPQA